MGESTIIGEDIWAQILSCCDEGRANPKHKCGLSVGMYWNDAFNAARRRDPTLVDLKEPNNKCTCRGHVDLNRRKEVEKACTECGEVGHCGRNCYKKWGKRPGRGSGGYGGGRGGGSGYGRMGV